ncbi:MAG: glutaredoxin 3 [Rhizobiaceae bacterium]|nr:glutaredoxin 3 [Rhizobiaceae bacterium]
MAQVKIYTRKMCGFCTAAIRLLRSKGAKFDELDATFSPALRGEMIARANGRSTFPQIFIGDRHVGGCDDLFALEKSGQLDSMLKG